MLDTSSSGDNPVAHHQAPGGAQTRSANSPSRSPSWSWLYVLVFLLTGAVLAFNILRPITVLPRITTGPGFAFENEAGEVITNEDYRGEFTLYSFTYSACDGQCAQTPEQIAAVQTDLARRIGDDTKLNFVTISLDPEHDTPQRLRELRDTLSNSWDVVNLPWSLVSGDPLRTRMTVGRGFGVYYAEPEIASGEDSSAARSVTFDPRYVLVDGWGVIRAEYRSAEPDPALLERDVNLLAQEARNSSGILRVGYEAAHLFACYPR